MAKEHKIIETETIGQNVIRYMNYFTGSKYVYVQNKRMYVQPDGSLHKQCYYYNNLEDCKLAVSNLRKAYNSWLTKQKKR